MTGAAVLAAITAFLELAKLEFAAAPAADQAKLATIHAHILERLVEVFEHINDDIAAGVNKLKEIIK